MKKVVMGITAILLLALVVSCANYKAYDLPQQEGNDQSLIDEIAALERDLNVQEQAPEEVPAPGEVEEEVVLPELEQEPEEFITEEDLDVITVKENELVKLNVKVTDPDKDTVTYSFSKPLNKDGAWKTNYGDAGEYIVTITASDGVHTTEKKVKLEVQRVNVPPVIEPAQDITVNEGEKVRFEPQVNDPNNDPVTVTISEPLRDGTFNTDHTSAGQYRIIIRGTDGELTAESTFTLTVNDINVPPEVSGLEDLTVNEGETVYIKPVVTDLDGDVVKVTITEPVGNDGIWETKYTDHGEYVITVTVDDGKERVVKTVTIVVVDVNKPPVFEDISVETR